MKTNFFKQVLPVAAFVVAIAGAFTSNAMEKSSKSASLINAYRKLNAAGTCENIVHTCETFNSGAVCRVSASPTSDQLWAKNASGACMVEVYRP